MLQGTGVQVGREAPGKPRSPARRAPLEPTCMQRSSPQPRRGAPQHPYRRGGNTQRAWAAQATDGGTSARGDVEAKNAPATCGDDPWLPRPRNECPIGALRVACTPRRPNTSVTPVWKMNAALRLWGCQTRVSTLPVERRRCVVGLHDDGHHFLHVILSLTLNAVVRLSTIQNRGEMKRKKAWPPE